MGGRREMGRSESGVVVGFEGLGSRATCTSGQSSGSWMDVCAKASLTVATTTCASYVQRKTGHAHSDHIPWLKGSRV